MGLVPALLIVSLLFLGAGGAPWLEVAAAATVTVLFVALWRLVMRPARRALDELLRTGFTAATMDIAQTVPQVLRMPYLVTARSGLGGAVAGSVLAAVAIVLLAGTLTSHGIDLWLLRIDGASPGFGLGAFVAMWMLFAAAILAVAGRVWLLGTLRRSRVEAPDTPRDQARISFWLAVLLVACACSTPLAISLLVLPLLILAFFAAYLAERDQFVRMVAVSFALALSFMGYQVRSPQIFDMVELQIARKDAKPLKLRVALIGTRGDAYAVAVCDRVLRETSQGDKRWNSTNPVLLRFSRDDALHAGVVRGGYAFRPERATTLLDAVLSIAYPGLKIPSLVSELNAPFDESRDVCGRVNGSAATARAASDALAMRLDGLTAEREPAAAGVRGTASSAPDTNPSPAPRRGDGRRR